MVVSALSTTIAMSSATPASDVSISTSQDKENFKQFTNGKRDSEVKETRKSQSDLGSNDSADEEITEIVKTNRQTLQLNDDLLEPVNSESTNEPSKETHSEINKNSDLGPANNETSLLNEENSCTKVMEEDTDKAVAEDGNNEAEGKRDDVKESQAMDQSSIFENPSMGQVNFKNILNFKAQQEPVDAIVKKEISLEDSLVGDAADVLAVDRSLVKEELIIEDSLVKSELILEEDEEAKSIGAADEELLDSDQQSNNGMVEDEITIEDETIIESTDEAMDDDQICTEEEPSATEVSHDVILNEEKVTKDSEKQTNGASSPEKNEIKDEVPSAVDNSDEKSQNEKQDVCNSDKLPEKIKDSPVNEQEGSEKVPVKIEDSRAKENQQLYDSEKALDKIENQDLYDSGKALDKIENQDLCVSEKVSDQIDGSALNQIETKSKLKDEAMDVDKDKVEQPDTDKSIRKDETAEAEVETSNNKSTEKMECCLGAESKSSTTNDAVNDELVEKGSEKMCRDDNDADDGVDGKSQFATAVKQFMDIGKKPESAKRAGEPLEESTNQKKPKLDPKKYNDAPGSSNARESVCLIDNDEEDADDPSPAASRSPSPSENASTSNSKSKSTSNETSSSATPAQQTVSVISMPLNREPLSSTLKFLREDAISKLTRSELEELMVQKICESICNRSQEGALRRRAEALEKEVFKWQEIGRCCEKQVRELKTVLHKYLGEIEKSKGSRPAAPMKVTRSVGLQVGQCPRATPPRAKPIANPVTQVKPPSSPAQRPNVRFPPPLKQGTPVAVAPKMLRTLTPVNSVKQSPVTPVPQNKTQKLVSPAKPILPKLPVKLSTPSTPSATPSSSASTSTSTNSADSGVIDLTDDDPVPVPTPPTPSAKSPGASPKYAYVMPGSGQPKYIISAQAPPPPLVFNGHTLKHPAPLPALPAVQPTRPSWKNIPPRPLLKISSTKTGIVLSWEMTLHADHEEIASYQLYAYQQGTSPPSPLLWREIGDVKALPLPMACTLSCFVPGYRYHFSVRAIDIHSRVGPFSLPGSILLKGPPPK